MSEIAEKYGIDLYTSGRCQCPRCARNGQDNSKDNLTVYGTDSSGRYKGAFCWACSFTIPSEEWLEENGVEEEKEYDLVGSIFNEEVHAKLKEITTVDSMGWRGIRKDTCSKFGVRHKYDPETGELTAQYYPTTEDNRLSGYKCRELPKKFSAIGVTGKECDLFGQFLFKNSNRNMVIVVGGEVDVLSAYQMLEDSAKAKLKPGEKPYEPIPVVSSTIGESGTIKQIQKQYEWFSRFDKILLCLDEDKAGKAAMDEIAAVLPKGKVFMVSMSLKDPNEYLKKGKTKEFVTAVYNARPYSPSGILGSSALKEAILNTASEEKIPLPPFMWRLQELMAGGIPLGKIINLGSASGTGKTTFSDELVYFWIFNSPYKVGIVSMEAEAGEYGVNLVSRHAGRKINLITTVEEKIEFLTRPDIVEIQDNLFLDEEGMDRFYLMDERDGGFEDLKEKVMQMIVKCGCRVIILDPLQDILDGVPTEEHPAFMGWQKGLTKSHKVTFININHVRKSGVGGKQNSEGGNISEEDFQGTSTIFKSGACNLLFMRNKLSEDPIERNTTIMKMTKCRWTGLTSPMAGVYYYDNATHTMWDKADFLEQHGMPAETEE